MKLRFVLLILSLVAAVPMGISQSTTQCVEDATISVFGGEDILINCNGDGEPDVFRFRVSQLATPFGYLITDNNNIIQGVSISNIIDLEPYGSGSFRVWAFSYLGIVTAQVGQDAATAELASVCFALTQNFIPVENVIPDGGVVATAEGNSTQYICPDDPDNGVVEFTTTSTNPIYTYLITDENNVVLDFAPDASYDFSASALGTCRVWGLSYVGNLLLEVGDDATIGPLADGCFSLSSTFIEVIKAAPDAAMVSLVDGTTEATLCVGDGTDDVLQFTNNSTSLAPYAYVITDDNNIILDVVVGGNSANFDGAPAGICRVWGLSFSGNITAEIGDDAAAVDLTDGCFDLSDNFIIVTRKEVDGGTVALASGGTEATICGNDGVADVLSYTNTSTSSEAYAYVVTDESNFILAILEGDSNDFDGAGVGICRVWGLSFSGNVLAQVGDNAGAIALSDECFELSTNFVVVTRKEVDGGTVATTDGETEITVCANDGVADIFAYTNTSTSSEAYAYVVTDENNIILDILSGDSNDFDGAGVGICRVWGLSFSGNVLAQVGDDAAAIALTDECFELSSNFVTVTRKEVDGGMVALTDGSTEVNVCANDGVADILSYTNTSTSSEAYAYVVTDENNIILDILSGDSSDFDGAGVGVCRVWGLSFSGNVLAQVGDDAAAVALTDECFELSSNFITVNRLEVDGGTVATTDGATEVTACTNDGVADIFSYTNTSTSSEAYAYVVTDENNIILDILSGDSNDFDGAGIGICRVWGLSFTGNVLAQVGDDAAAVALTDECFELSSNFITVTRKEVDGGMVALTDGSTEVNVCANDGVADILSYTNTSTSSEAYAYVVTDENNIILDILSGDSSDFDGAGVGVCRVWGLSFSGNVLAQVGDDAAITMLTDECFELSSNFITVNRLEVDGGMVATTDGATEATVCVNDGVADVLAYTNTSTSSANYAYVVTDDNNIIIAILEGDSNDFDGAGIGICRVWGLSFTGNVLAQVGDDAAAVALTDECFELSSNFVTVTRKEVDGGTVALADGGTEVNICANDGVSDVLTYTNTSASSEAYAYVVTDENNIILDILDGDSNDFDGAGLGICRVWGLSFSGNVLAQAGDDAAATMLTDECFELSSNFITVNRLEVDGGMVTTTDGATEATVCVNDGIADILSYTNTSTSAAPYVYVVTDENNIILEILSGDNNDFDGAGIGICRVWGLSFTGNVLAQVGDDAAITTLTDECFELSENFITVTRKEVDGGMVALSDGGTEASVCVTDGEADVLSYTNTSTSSEAYAYVVTDENNIILEILDGDSNDFDGAGLGVCRVWGLSFSGNVLAQAGDDAAVTMLTDECFELSSNFITVTRKEVDGGTLVLADGSDAALVCIGGGTTTVLDFSVTTTSTESYVFVITDEDNTILALTEDPTFDFADAMVGICRIWGLSYSGNVIAALGDDAGAVALSDECFDLSSNFITVTRRAVDGGTVAFGDGTTDPVFACVGDEEPDVFGFVGSPGVVSTYAFIITDENNEILNILSDGANSQDFNGVGVGICRVWGLSYTGNIIAEVGQNAALATLTDECFDLSNNFLEVIRDQVDGGMVSMPNGSVQRFICPGDGIADIVNFDSTGSTSANYIYVITDTENVILDVVDGDSFNFDQTPDGICRVWGLAYSGELTATIGDDADEVALSDACFDLSDNFIRIIRDRPDGGDVSTPDGEIFRYTCPGDGVPDIVMFDSTTTSNSQYLYLITDDSNFILDIVTVDFADFEDAPVGICRVWGLAFTGLLTAEIGDNAGEVALSDDCFDLSDSFITVIREVPEGGQVTTSNEQSSVFICPGDDMEDVINFDSIDASNSLYVYVVTDEDNVILEILDGDEGNFDTAPSGICRVWGLAYTGTLTASAGDNAAEVALSDDCFDLSDNFVTLIRETPNAGVITANGGQTEFDLCVGDGTFDLINFEVEGASNSEYLYLVTNDEGFLIGALEQDSFDFEFAIGGTFLIYGLAYTGNFAGFPGDNIFEFPLSTDCFDITETPLTINSTQVDGAFVTTNLIQQEVFVCPGDGEDDFVTFINTTSASMAEYVYIVTTESNLIVGILPGSTQNFENTGFDVLRVWGVSYTGEFLGAIGQNAAEVPLSDDCFALSGNFVTIIRDEPDGGMISDEDGATEIDFCIVNGDTELTVVSTTESIAGYLYLLTDEDNIIIDAFDGAVDFADFPQGTYRIWGLSYTGLPVAEPGMDASMDQLASSCFELSENFMTITIGETVDGGILSTFTGETTIYTCPGDDIADIVALSTTSLDTMYRYVITDTLNQVLQPDIEGDLIDFDAAAPGVCRIYGISFTGDFDVSFGENVFEDALSTDCWAVSENFITLVRQEPEGGMVATLDGSTAVEVIVGDEEADIVEFEAFGAGIAQYIFVITDDSNNILALTEEPSFDFEEAPAGICRIWGLSYTGMITAQIGDNAAAVELTDDCFDLSDNFITVTRTEDENIGGTEESPTLALGLTPNPAVDWLAVEFDLTEGSAPTSFIQVMDFSGSILLAQNIGAQQGRNRIELPISDLTSGTYIVRVINGNMMDTQLFVKQQD